MGCILVQHILVVLCMHACMLHPRQPAPTALLHSLHPLLSNACRFIDGYTLRSYTMKGLILQEVAPPLDEVSRFNQAGQAGEAEDASVSAALPAMPACTRVGRIVR